MENKKGAVGLNILLSVLSSVFVIGILLGLFAITGSEMEEQLYIETTDSLNETLSGVNSTNAVAVSTNSLRDCSDLTLTAVHNSTESGALITAGNYTISGCTVLATSGSPFENEDWHIIGTANYQADSVGSLAVNDTTTALTDVTNWLPIIIIITAIVVLIILVVMIMKAIRGTETI